LASLSMIEFSPGLSDKEVLDLANRENRVPVTFDKDLGELVVKKEGCVKGLTPLRFTPHSPQQTAKISWQIINSNIPIENTLIIVKEHIIRVTGLK